MARRLRITDRDIENAKSLTRVEDLEFSENGEMDAVEMFAEAGWSPYYLDAEAGKTLFVRLPEHVDLARICIRLR